MSTSADLRDRLSLDGLLFLWSLNLRALLSLRVLGPWLKNDIDIQWNSQDPRLIVTAAALPKNMQRSACQW